MCGRPGGGSLFFFFFLLCVFLIALHCPSFWSCRRRRGGTKTGVRADKDETEFGVLLGGPYLHLAYDKAALSAEWIRNKKHKAQSIQRCEVSDV